jgi:hypothetical protein
MPPGGPSAIIVHHRNRDGAFKTIPPELKELNVICSHIADVVQSLATKKLQRTTAANQCFGFVLSGIGR